MMITRGNYEKLKEEQSDTRGPSSIKNISVMTHIIHRVWEAVLSVSLQRWIIRDLTVEVQGEEGLQEFSIEMPEVTNKLLTTVTVCISAANVSHNRPCHNT